MPRKVPRIRAGSLCFVKSDAPFWPKLRRPTVVPAGSRRGGAKRTVNFFAEVAGVRDTTAVRMLFFCSGGFFFFHGYRKAYYRMSGGASTLVVSQSARANSNVLAQDTIDPFTGDVDVNAITVGTRVESAEEIQRRIAAENRTQIEQEACYPQLNMYNLVVNAFGRITVPSVPAVMATMVIHNNTMPVWNYEFRVQSKDAHEVAFEMMHYVADHDTTHFVIAEKILDLTSIVPDPLDRSVHHYVADLDLPGSMSFTNWTGIPPRFRLTVQRAAGTGRDDQRGTCSETTEDTAPAAAPTCSATTSQSEKEVVSVTDPGHVGYLTLAHRSDVCSDTSSSRAIDDIDVPAVAVAGYYPLYHNEYHARRASPDNGRRSTSSTVRNTTCRRASDDTWAIWPTTSPSVTCRTTRCPAPRPSGTRAPHVH